jgi:2-oxoisovalerate dehydrogenase E2 component (dihydrolipoyl transacylase)
MAIFTFRLPDIGEGIAEAEIVGWHVKVGERIEEDAPLVDMMTDKATVEMESPFAGTIVSVAGAEGDVISIGSTLVEIETEGEVESEAEAPPAEEAIIPEPQFVAEKPEPAPRPAREEPASKVGVAQVAASNSHEKVLASPAVRKRAHELGIDLARVKPLSGDRIRHADLDAFLGYGGGAGRGARLHDEQVKVIGLRKRIAQNMAESKRHIPHFTYVEEIDVTALEEMRGQMNAERGDRPKLTALPLIIAAICRTLRDFPMLNAHYDDEANVVTRLGAVHMGIATQTDAGLMVPVLRGAESMSVWDMASDIARLADAAREGKARSEELSGSTITLTSLGPLGGIVTTPVINRPEVAIIGPNKIVERPMVIDGEVAIRKMMNQIGRAHV